MKNCEKQNIFLDDVRNATLVLISFALLSKVLFEHQKEETEQGEWVLNELRKLLKTNLLKIHMPDEVFIPIIENILGNSMKELQIYFKSKIEFNNSLEEVFEDLTSKS